MSYTKGTWNTGDQIREHKLACSIINLHGTEDCVFDEPSLDELEAFTLARSTATRDAFMSDRDEAAAKRSLSDFIIARYGMEDAALDERDWELLEAWFRRGRPAGETVSR